MSLLVCVDQNIDKGGSRLLSRAAAGDACVPLAVGACGNQTCSNRFTHRPAVHVVFPAPTAPPIPLAPALVPIVASTAPIVASATPAVPLRLAASAPPRTPLVASALVPLVASALPVPPIHRARRFTRKCGELNQRDELRPPLRRAAGRVAARVPQRYLGHRRCEEPAAYTAAVAQQAELGGIGGTREAAGTADQPRAWLGLGWA